MLSVHITYEFLQILGSGSPVNNRDSGFYQEGWDWNFFPGTTVVRLPLEELKARVCVVDATAGYEEMLISDESFAGGVSMDGMQGAFGMILHGHGKYDGSFRARKSWFFFDNRIICLGSSIEAGKGEHEVITTLYQTCLTEKHREAYIGTEAITGLSEELRCDGEGVEAVWLTDPCKNRYRIPAGQHLAVQQSMQNSRSQDTGATVQGAFSKAWLVHQKAPHDAGYEYMIQVMPEYELTETEWKQAPPYRVAARNKRLHAVTDIMTTITGYVFFEASAIEPEGDRFVKEVSAPCLIMERRKEDVLTLSVCDPDLRFYEGTEPDQLLPDRTQKEVSLYSRTWRAKESIGSWVKVVLNGTFKAHETVKHVRVFNDAEETIVEVYCIGGRVTQMNLKNVGLKL